MIGAGIFAAAGPAAVSAGGGLILAVALAGLAAFLNATTMAQLAAQYPESGGTYVYGRNLLGHYWGFLAGIGFVIGKTASCTAMALAFAHYAFPSAPHVVAVLTVLTLTTLNYFGVKKTVTATKLMVAVVLITLALTVGAAWLGGNPEVVRLMNWTERGGIGGILQAAAFMFFAFAGYARIATLGEEVTNPRVTIPRAIITALSITLVLYLVVIATVLSVLPIEDLIASGAPLALAVERTAYAHLSPLIRVGAAVATLSVLLSLLVGISRTMFAMSYNRDLPHVFSAVHPKYKIPHRAEVAVGLIVAVVVGFADLRSAIGFSSFAILTYYAIANWSALRLSAQSRLFPRLFAHLGLGVCLTLAWSLPVASILGGVLIFTLASLAFWFFRIRARGNGQESE
ncbi:MAG: APC family permease [Bdellovibrionaceae bacterium]|nr:APC family permease [Pseudobdellovibrionaceae bacterium]